MIDHTNFEESCGVRFTYENIPNHQDILSETKSPLVLLNTPFKSISTEIVNYQFCKCKCDAILNPFCSINYDYFTWSCNFCNYKNKFPSNYKTFLKEKSTPIEAQENNYCIEYIRSNNDNNNLYFSIVIDKCVELIEFNEIKKGLINLIPELANNLKIILISFDRFVQFYTKKSKYMTILNQFSPFLNPIDFLNQLTFYNFDDYIFNMNNEEEKEKLINTIENIEASNFIVKSNERYKTSTGKAFDYILEFKMKFKLDTLRSLFIIAGPCTISTGKFIYLDKSIHPRNKLDLEKNNKLAKRANKSKEYFEGLTKKAVLNKVTFDIIGFSLNEYGYFEMSSMVEKTGGFVMFNEQFKKEQYHKGLKQYFSKSKLTGYSKFCFNGEYKVICSNNIKINGSLGGCSSIETNNKENVSKEKLFESDTNIWFTGCCDYSSTILTFFSIEDKNNKNIKLEDNSNIFFQTIFTYIHPDGSCRIRVITIPKTVIVVQEIKEYGNMIDSISLVIVYIKMVADRSKILEQETLLRWLDRNLLLILKKFSHKGNINENLQVVPQFFYYLRKSCMLRQISISLDEISFFRTLILREETANILIMIQPALYEYNSNNEEIEGEQILCEIGALKKNVVILMDNYINIMIWKGDDIIQWEKEGYFEKEEYEYLNNLNTKPQEEINKCLEDRLFYPEIFYSYKDAPNERILKTKLNPDRNKIESPEDDESLITDDHSFSIFWNKILEIIRRNNN